MLFIFSLNLVKATTIPLSQIPVGKVVSVNGKKFIKVGENQYLAVAPVSCGVGYYLTNESCQTCASKTANCSTCNANNGTCTACGGGRILSGGSCIVDPATTLQGFTKAKCNAASIGVVGTYSNNGSGSYTIRKLADGNCYVNMNIQKQWYGSNVATGDCVPSSTSFPACNTCYAINKNSDWFLPTNAQLSAVSSQLYTGLGLSGIAYFWTSSEYTSDTNQALLFYVSSSQVIGSWAAKKSAFYVLCRRD
jgi:hypothetical protein